MPFADNRGGHRCAQAVDLRTLDRHQDAALQSQTSVSALTYNHLRQKKAPTFRGQNCAMLPQRDGRMRPQDQRGIS